MLIMLRVKELATAEKMTDHLSRVEVFTLMNVSGVDGSSDPDRASTSPASEIC